MTPTHQSYGSVEEGRATNGHARHSEENAPLLSKSTSKSSYSRLHDHMNQEIDTNGGEFILLFGYIITGLIDGSSVFIWGAFASMQTGNTIYLGLGLANPSSGNRWIKSILSITCFCLGATVFAWYHRFFTPKKRWVMFSSYLFQMLLTVAAATIVTLDRTTEEDKEGLRWAVLVPLALMAVSGSGQCVSSRALDKNSLTSVVLTSIYCDLFSDPRLLSFSGNPSRNQRVAAPICVFLGALAGGFWAHSEIGLPGALWTAAGLKFCTVVAWTGWRIAPENHD
ncbi:hypothetical protein EG328_010421 [Venturia inaequalis]|uniref:DUF1275 domain protein n=2 Tax=Venturia inaequalis TaxID=5025 RepID=A0A8H3U980_VENIN|nr:hypothetical protein EG328_010421 [Venturia inaequalis]RDI76879.1 hypothetical protein Vi05172_g13101 [Venturia inaequalis]